MTMSCGSSQKTKRKKETAGKADPKVGVGHGKTQGITTSHWFWGGVEAIANSGAKKAPVQQKSVAPNAPVDNADDIVQKLLLENPTVSGPALIQALKAKGITFGIDKSITAPVDKKAEADSASSNTQFLRSDKPKKEADLHFTALKMKESSPRDNGIGYTKFTTTMLQEGLGNFKDGFYYTKEALASAIPIFEGKKIYADHPSAIDEQSRPERSVRDVLGHFENVRVEETDGRAALTGDVVILPEQDFEWARGLMRHAIEYRNKFPGQEFIGLSINAGGDAEEMSIEAVMESAPQEARNKLLQAKGQGLTTVRVVKAIQSAISCDLVTEAGAGGKINNLIEGERAMDMHKQGEAPAADGQQDHADAAQDVELIKKMIADHVDQLHKKAAGSADGEDAKESEGEAKQAEAKHHMEMIGHEAYEMCKAKGMEHEKAMEFAKQSMEFAHHLKQKEQSMNTNQHEGEMKPGQVQSEDMKPGQVQAEADDADADDKKDDKIKKMEAELIALKGKLAFHEAEQRKTKIKTYADKKLQESKLSNKITAAFKEAAGDFKDEKDFDSKFKLFCEGQRAKDEVLNFAFTEKGIVTEAMANGTEGSLTLNFGHLAE